MPATYYVYPRRRVAVITWESGLPDLASWRAVFDALLIDPSFGEGFGVVSDWRTAVEAPDEEFLRGAVEYASDVFGERNLRWASVTPRESAMVDAGSAIASLASERDLDYHTFTDLRAAIAWAGRQ
jgi:hypothetical protein